jgi:hypothetical protein
MHHLEGGNMGRTNTWAVLKHWLHQRRQDKAQRRQDFADHGTAFAMELSMTPPEAQAEPAGKPWAVPAPAASIRTRRA